MRLSSKFLKKFTTKEMFDGNGATVIFNLSSTPQENEAVQVYVDGLLREEGASKDYQLSGTTITFNTAPANAQRIEVHYWKNSGE